MVLVSGQLLIGRRRRQAKWRTAGQLLVALVLTPTIGRARFGHYLLLGPLGQHQILLDAVIVVVVVI